VTRTLCFGRLTSPIIYRRAAVRRTHKVLPLLRRLAAPSVSHSKHLLSNRTVGPSEARTLVVGDAYEPFVPWLRRSEQSEDTRSRNDILLSLSGRLAAPSVALSLERRGLGYAPRGAF